MAQRQAASVIMLLQLSSCFSYCASGASAYSAVESSTAVCIVSASVIIRDCHFTHQRFTTVSLPPTSSESAAISSIVPCVSERLDGYTRRLTVNGLVRVYWLRRIAGSKWFKDDGYTRRAPRAR